MFKFLSFAMFAHWSSRKGPHWGTSYHYKRIIGIWEKTFNIPIWLCNIPSDLHFPFCSIVQLFKSARQCFFHRQWLFCLACTSTLLPWTRSFTPIVPSWSPIWSLLKSRPVLVGGISLVACHELGKEIIWITRIVPEITWTAWASSCGRPTLWARWRHPL
jgi:hypothetical protein